MSDDSPCPAGATPPTWQLILADSELAGCAAAPGAETGAGATVVLAFAAAHLRQAGGDSGHAPGLRLVLTDATIDGEIGPGRLREGRLWHGGRWQGGWTVPGRLGAAAGVPLRLELTGAHGDTLTVTAHALQAMFSGPDGHGDASGPAGWRPWLHC